MDLLKELKESASLVALPVAMSSATLYGFLSGDCRKHGWNLSTVGFSVLAVLMFVGICWQATIAFNVPEPYLVSATTTPEFPLSPLLRSSRTRSSTYPRPRNTLLAGGLSGITRSLHLLDCTCLPCLFFWVSKLTAAARYATSIAISKWLWAQRGECSATILRMTNWFALPFLGLTAMKSRRLIEARLSERDVGKPRPHALSIYAIHTGMNIGLFPLLFFFSALYYTDVYSTLFVLAAFQTHLQRVDPRGKSLWSDLWTILQGVTALCFRQTNVFWVVVFMGGLEVVHAIKTLPLPRIAQLQPRYSGPVEKVKYYVMLCSWGFIHDPALNLVSLDGKLVVALWVLNVAGN